MSSIQAVLFDRNYWDLKQTFEWLYNHHIYPMKKAHITNNYIRYRIQLPNKFNRLRTISTNDGIKFIIGYYDF